MEKPLPFNSSTPVPNTHILNSQKGREDELEGGMRNALERGEQLPKIKQSFLNAGYSAQEVNVAANRLSQISQTPHEIIPQKTTLPVAEPKKHSMFSNFFSKKETPKQIPIKSSNDPLPRSQPTYKPAAIQQPKKLSRIWIISMIVVSAMILIGAAVLGLYWDKIF